MLAAYLETARRSARSTHSHNLFKLGGGNRLNGQPRQTQQSHLLQLRVPLDLVERDRPGQWLFRCKIDSAPVALLGRGVGVGLANYPGDPEHGLVRYAVIIEDRVAFAHRAQIIARSEIPDAGPGCLSVTD